MNSEGLIKWKLFLVSFFTILLGMVAGGCSDDKEELQGSRYGYVQFKIYKQASYVQEETAQTGIRTASTRSTVLDKLGDVQKVEIEMSYDGRSIIQTLLLGSYNESNAEYGVRSNKLQLLVGEYKIIGYKLLDKLDKVVLSMSADADETFTVVSRGLTLKDLTVDVQARGTVTFKLVKTGLPAPKSMVRASNTGSEYLFSDIKLITITVTNTFTKVSKELPKMKVVYKEDYKENQNPDNPDDKYMDIGIATCDSAVWLPVGTYRVTSYTAYSKSGAVEKVLGNGLQTVEGDEFTVEDNKLTQYANVPVVLSETAEYIKDYLALKEIWEALDGKNWSYYGETDDGRTNWNFNKELDMWGDQPGVTLDTNGRVTGLSLEGFGAKGRVPDAIGQLTELKLLALGTHGEKIGAGRLFGQSGISPDMDETQKEKMRMHYKETFLDYDPRENMSELLQDGINRNPDLKPIRKSNRITLKDTQIGNLSNNITFVSKAVMRLSNLQLFYMANSPFFAEDICSDWENPDSEYAVLYKDENLSWDNMEALTDVELYNCPNLTRLPEFLYELPEMQLLNISCNRGIPGEQLKDDWGRLAGKPAGAKLQILYMGYNNLEAFPDDGSIKNMKKLGLLDCVHNKISKVEPFGADIKLATLTLDYNEITEIPDNFCGFTDQVESLSFTHNKLKFIPNIFNANSVYVMGSVDFSYNEIGGYDKYGNESDNGVNISCEAGDFKGINASTVTLSNNRIRTFPTELFASGSPISTLSLSGNLMTEVPENSLKPANGQYKNTYLLTVIDLRFNKLTRLSDDFRATTLPYLSNMDVSYNCFSTFPTSPLNSSQLQAFGIRHQRDSEGNRILREWPEGITTCPSLIQLQIGSNDIRKVNETMTPKLWILDIKDNPNISIDLSSICPYIEAGMYKLIYDKTQDIRGCDALDIKR